jgi:hypothetical protein
MIHNIVSLVAAHYSDTTAIDRSIEQYPVAISQNLIVLSRDDEIKKSPAGVKMTHETLWSWPRSVLEHSNVCVFQSLIVISAEQDAGASDAYGIANKQMQQCNRVA